MGNENQPMVPMFAPDGTPISIPIERMHDALQAGGKMGVNMNAPDGTPVIIPADRTQEAVKAGGKVVPYDMDSHPDKEGFVSHVGQSLRQFGSNLFTPPDVPTSFGDAVKQGVLAGTGATGALIGAGKEYLAARGRGHGVPYSAAAGASSIVGVNPQRMEQAAEQGDTGGVLGEAAVPTALAVGGYGASSAADRVFGNVQRAGKLFNEVSTAAKGAPIEITDAMSQAASRMQELHNAGAKGMPRVISKFVARVTDPEKAPISWQESRDFYSNVSRLSANEYESMNPQMAAQVGKFAGAFNDALRATAEAAGKGDEYSQAMQLYRSAKVWQKFGSNIWQGFKTALPYAGGTAVGAAAGKSLYDFLAGK